MDNEPYGTDGDHPPSHESRIPRGKRVTRNGRPFAASIPYSRMYGETDMETQIHQLEQEAYSSVLRAFEAQADAITWEKEILISKLRKELRLSNKEHMELFSLVNSDDVIQRIREWRRIGGLQSGMHSTGQAVHDPVLSPTVSQSRKKQKITSPVPFQSLGGPSSSFHPQVVFASRQPSSSAKRGPATGSKSKKQKPGLPDDSSMKSIPHPSSSPSGRGQVVNRISFANINWGGEIIRTAYGVDYNVGFSKMFNFSAVSDFKSLLKTINSVIGLEDNHYVSGVMFRQPMLIFGAVNYGCTQVQNDNDLQTIREYIKHVAIMDIVQFYVDIDITHTDTNLDNNDDVDNDVDHDDGNGNDVDNDNEDGDSLLSIDNCDDDNNGDNIIEVEVGEGGNQENAIIQFSNPVLPLVHNPPHSNIGFDLTRVDIWSKPVCNSVFDPSKEFTLGMTFSSRDAVKEAAKEYSTRKNHQFKSKETKENTYRIICIDSSCEWMLRATKKSGQNHWIITKYNGPHTCSNSQMCKDYVRR